MSGTSLVSANVVVVVVVVTLRIKSWKNGTSETTKERKNENFYLVFEMMKMINWWQEINRKLHLKIGSTRRRRLNWSAPHGRQKICVHKILNKPRRRRRYELPTSPTDPLLSPPPTLFSIGLTVVVTCAEATNLGSFWLISLRRTLGAAAVTAADVVAKGAEGRRQTSTTAINIRSSFSLSLSDFLCAVFRALSLSFSHESPSHVIWLSFFLAFAWNSRVLKGVKWTRNKERE